MSMLANFQFLQPQWLLLLPPLWLLIYLHARRSDGQSMWERTCDTRLLAEMTFGQGRKKPSVTVACLLGAILSTGVVAMAAPSWSRIEQPLMEASSARIIVLDLSRSMLVQDIKPNRFLHARAAASEIIGNDFSGETGLVVFAGSAFILSPLSRDSDSLLAFIEAVDPGSMPQDGSHLSAAIETSLDLLAASFSGQGQILLITAGDSSDSAAVQVALDAAAAGQRISVLAIGSTAGGPLLDEDGGLLRDAAGRIRLSRSNLSLLRRIATAGNGRLAIAGETGSGGDLLSSRVDADELVESTHKAEKSEREAANDGAWLVWLILLPALWLFRRNQLWLLLLVILAPMPRESVAADDNTFWNHRESIAFDAYRRGDYDRVGQLSQLPLMLGASYYHRGQFEQALIQFSQHDSADAHYNQANALVQLQRYPEALASYRQALTLDPGMSKARYNKLLLEHFLEQQPNATASSRDPSADGDPGDEPENDEAQDARIGIATEIQANPADDPEIGTGAGASMQNGQVDPSERFSGDDLELERFILRPQDLEQPAIDSIERWIGRLPDTSNELYRRKFLRDYRRQQLQER